MDQAVGEPADVTHIVERLLAGSLGGDVRLGAIERVTEAGRSNELLRCRVAAAPPGAPASVMVKRRRNFRPDAHDDSGTRGLYRNWAGLRFLTELRTRAGDTGGDAGGVDAIGGAPRFYGGSRDAGLVVMEDLGAPHSLADVLLRGEATAAERGLLLLAGALGRLHAATAGRERDYLRIRTHSAPATIRLSVSVRQTNSAERPARSWSTSSRWVCVRRPASLRTWRWWRGASLILARSWPTPTATPARTTTPSSRPRAVPCCG